MWEAAVAGLVKMGIRVVVSSMGGAMPTGFGPILTFSVGMDRLFAHTRQFWRDLMWLYKAINLIYQIKHDL